MQLGSNVTARLVSLLSSSLQFHSVTGLSSGSMETVSCGGTGEPFSRDSFFSDKEWGEMLGLCSSAFSEPVPAGFTLVLHRSA